MRVTKRAVSTQRDHLAAPALPALASLLLLVCACGPGATSETAVSVKSASLRGSLETPRVVSATAKARLSHASISVGQPALASVNVHKKFVSIEDVCFAFSFAEDLLDPGEAMIFFSNGPGFENIGPSAQAQRTLCFGNYPDLANLFLDGKEKNILLEMQTGSVKVAELQVTVTGVARERKGDDDESEDSQLSPVDDRHAPVAP
jgi:hypothetical protein